MIRKFKVLGLALVAVCAMGAVMASSAMALTEQGELTSDGSVKLTGTDTIGQKSVLSFGPDKVTCHGHYLTGKENVTPHGFTTLPLTTLTVAPTYTLCEAHKGVQTLPATVTMNGCDYLLHIGKTSPPGSGTFAVTADIVCPAGKVIEIHAYSSGTHESSVCTYTIGAQTGLAGGFAQNTEEGGVKKVTLGGTFKNIAAKRDKTVLCGAEEEIKTAEFTIHTILSGSNVGGGATEVTLSEI